MPCVRGLSSRSFIRIKGKNVLRGTAQLAARLLMRDQDSLFAEDAKLANDLEAIPRGEALETLLRAQAANERNLNLAIDHLEHLQRQRKGEAVPPQLSVRLSRLGKFRKLSFTERSQHLFYFQRRGWIRDIDSGDRPRKGKSQNCNGSYPLTNVRFPTAIGSDD